MPLRSGVLPREQESRTGKGVRSFVPLPFVPPNSESQLLSGKGNTKEKREKLELSRSKPSCRTFPTCSDAYRFGGSRRELGPSPARMQAGKQRSKPAPRARNWLSSDA